MTQIETQHMITQINKYKRSEFQNAADINKDEQTKHTFYSKMHSLYGYMVWDNPQATVTDAGWGGGGGRRTIYMPVSTEGSSMPTTTPDRLLSGSRGSDID